MKNDMKSLNVNLGLNFILQGWLNFVIIHANRFPIIMAKSSDSGTKLPGFLPTSSLTSSVSWDKSLDPSMPLFLYLCNDDIKNAIAYGYL